MAGRFPPDWTAGASVGPSAGVENLYRTLVHVRRGASRVDADELTYPVHIMLRYELEKRILDGRLPVRDLQQAWSDGLEERLGLRPASDAEGCLQDVHWAVGSFGYFPSYVLGGIIAAQFYEKSATTCTASTRTSPRASSARSSSGCATTCTASAPA